MWLELVNSDHLDYLGSGRSEDRLKHPGWLEAFLGRWGLAPAKQVDQTTIAALVTLRALLRRMAVALSKGQPLSDEDLRVLNELLSASPTARQLRRSDGPHGAGEPLYRLEWTHTQNDWNLVLAEIVASFAALLARNETYRFKVCQNPDCGCVFYDESPNLVRRWCENTCGNLMKVRRFRARQRASSDKPNSQVHH
jgi:predicted RNA-binding Zn ribbon-like protein